MSIENVETADLTLPPTNDEVRDVEHWAKHTPQDELGVAVLRILKERERWMTSRRKEGYSLPGEKPMGCIHHAMAEGWAVEVYDHCMWEPDSYRVIMRPIQYIGAGVTIVGRAAAIDYANEWLRMRVQENAHMNAFLARIKNGVAP